MIVKGVIKMRIVKILNNQGVTLLELILVLLLCSLLVSLYIGIVSQSIHYWQEKIEEIRIHENLQYSMHFIEKNLRQFNQQQLEYFPDILQIRSENSQGETSYMDFSGKIIYHYNTYLYYHAGNRQLRINRNKEHNVLAQNIDNIEVREIIPDILLEVTISSFDKQGEMYSLKSKIRICSRR